MDVTIETDVLKKHLKAALAKHAKGNEMDEKETARNASADFTDLNAQFDEVSFKDGHLTIWSTARLDDGTALCSIYEKVKLPLETVASINEYYVKKLNRLRTVLEATE